MTFNDRVTSQRKSQRRKAVSKNLGPEIIATPNQLDDILYLADACASELKSIADGIYERAPTDIGFKCSPEEYQQKILECKKQADWLVNNLELWS